MQVFLNLGLLGGYILTYVFSKLPLYLGWRLMLRAGGFPSVCLIAGILVMPESPRWLVMQGRFSEARQVFDRTSDSKAKAQLCLADIIEAAAKTTTTTATKTAPSPWKELFLRPTPIICHILIAAVGINFFRQASALTSPSSTAPQSSNRPESTPTRSSSQ